MTEVERALATKAQRLAEWTKALESYKAGNGTWAASDAARKAYIKADYWVICARRRAAKKA